MQIMKLEILVMCFGFEKRLNWMLSSIARCAFSIKTCYSVNICTTPDINSKLQLSCADIIDNAKIPTSSDYILKLYNLPRACFQNRGLQRNFQVMNLDYDTNLVLFADCDHIYDYSFFDEFIEKALSHRKEFGTHYMYTTRRISTDDLNKMNKLINNEKYPSYIENTVEKYKQLKTRVTSAPGAGNCQLVFKEDLDGYYVKEEEIRDRNFFNNITFRSDKQFRKRFKDVIKIETKGKQYHLQHNRLNYEDLIQQ